MPSYVNIGHVLIRTNRYWAIVGSCAQIGKMYILAEVLNRCPEPIQNNPVIIEDNCSLDRDRL